VAAFHALVDIAAVFTSLASFWISADHTSLHKIACYISALIGGIIFTGSIAAFLKLSGYKTGHLALPFNNYWNAPLGALNLLALATLISTHSTGLGSALLLYATASSFALGWYITNSIGSADMPVAITVLNSYSGWALCAEGFMLNNTMLTIVGSLIGYSGGILSYNMCRAMNRSLYNVIFAT
jgi:NAD(P) transhydrogenase